VNLLLLLPVITGKAEAFIYKSPSYNDAKRYEMLGEQLSQLNDKAREQKYRKGNQRVSQAVQCVSQAVPGESEVTKNRTWFVMMGKD
jgi:hypothetical protein